MTFKLNIDEHNKSVQIVLHDEPKYGKRFISEEERYGIQRSC
jgi:hypothetical protein